MSRGENSNQTTTTRWPESSTEEEETILPTTEQVQAEYQAETNVAEELQAEKPKAEKRGRGRPRKDERAAAAPPTPEPKKPKLPKIKPATIGMVVCLITNSVFRRLKWADLTQDEGEQLQITCAAVVQKYAGLIGNWQEEVALAAVVGAIVANRVLLPFLIQMTPEAVPSAAPVDDKEQPFPAPAA